MKFLIIFTLALFSVFANCQSLPLNFDSNFDPSNFIDFSGGMAAIVDNPDTGGSHTSPMVARIIREGGEIWAGSKIVLDENLDFTTDNSISMFVFTDAPAGAVMKLKLENGSSAVERDAITTVSGEWEMLNWDFTGTPTEYNELVFMFDYGIIGDGSKFSTFYFDFVEQIFGGTHIDLPVDFEGVDVNYTMSDFGGNVSTLVEDPVNAENHVIQVVKTIGAATWAGTTIGTPAGFATNIPLSLDDSKMYARVWSPEAGTPIRLKVEDSSDPTHTCETETNTTLSGEWEVIEFNFLNQAPGTELLSIGLEMGWTYNMASIFFNFGTDGATAGEKTYFFDDIQFGEFTSNNSSIEFTNVEVFPNPTTDNWVFKSDNALINKIELIISTRVI